MKNSLNRLISGWREQFRHHEILYFGIVGAIGFAVDLASFTLLRSLSLVIFSSCFDAGSFSWCQGDIGARMGAIAIAILVTWWLNRQLTFKSTDPLWGRELWRFTLTRLLGSAINAVISLGILWEFPATPAALALACGAGAAMVINYFTAKYYAYKI